MPTGRGIRLRTLSWAVTLVVLGAALTVTAALLLLTHYIHQTNNSLAASVESVRLAREIELLLDLLAQVGPHDQTVRHLRGDLRETVQQAGHYVVTAHEAAALLEAANRIDLYLNASREHRIAPGELTRLRAAALDATDRFVAVNVAQSLAAREQADHWDRLANRIGLGCGAFLLTAAALLAWWLRTRAFRPLIGLAATMEAFARGRRDLRADEVGPHELREIAGRFNAMADVLAAQRAAQMTFLGGVAHDLKNPLAALRLALAAQARDPESAVRTRRTLDIVARQTSHLERMVGDFIDIARIEAGKLELRPVDSDLRELVRESAALFDGYPRHQLALDLPPEPTLVRCDPLRVTQIVVNLISNAVKYSPEGGPVEISVTATADLATVAVRDHGVGMSEAEVRRIFEPFSRVGLSRDAIPGVGLGLHVLLQLVQAHGGAVDVDSAPGRGSTFRVHLPRRGPALNAS
ncbi:Signal transduction histidine kinase [Nannocystis exedens]|uniref:histidine kinase n=1 Tax=Nannocystis exedens TaxID=54 RepID=A0A1I2DQI8_9BACT|nr:HAMP domain-containing sensor histidine kinase [Nannocystis exedens]PCC68994.1 two-component sensor histidine kinase [Nannocystis exedens]SFE82573.1 Signal transduction histidine kinase [Nannocystis exedens]